MKNLQVCKEPECDVVNGVAWSRAYAKGGVGVKTPLWAWCFTKLYYLRNGD